MERTSVKKERIKVNYKPLWKMMIDKDISKGELRAKTGIAPSTFAKMSNNEYVALDVLHYGELAVRRKTEMQLLDWYF